MYHFILANATKPGDLCLKIGMLNSSPILCIQAGQAGENPQFLSKDGIIELDHYAMLELMNHL